MTGGKASRIDWESLEVPFWLADRLDRLGFKFPTGVGLGPGVCFVGPVPQHTLSSASSACIMGFPFFLAQRYSGGQRQYFWPEWTLRYRARPDQVCGVLAPQFTPSEVCGVPAPQFTPSEVYHMLDQIPPTQTLY